MTHEQNKDKKRAWRTQQVSLYLENNLTEEQTQKLVTLIQQAEEPIVALRDWFNHGDAPKGLYASMKAPTSLQGQEIIDWQDVLDTYLLDKDIPLKGKKA